MNDKIENTLNQLLAYADIHAPPVANAKHTASQCRRTASTVDAIQQGSKSAAGR